MKPTYAGIAASAALASSLIYGIQEGNKGNSEAPAGQQLTTAQLEAEFKTLNVFKELVKDEDGSDVFELSIDGVSVQFHTMNSEAGAPQAWRFSGGWDLSAAPRPDDVNRFNANSRQAYSYLDSQYDPFLVMEHSVSAGATVEMLRGVVDTYRRALPDFKAIVLRNRA